MDDYDGIFKRIAMAIITVFEQGAKDVEFNTAPSTFLAWASFGKAMELHNLQQFCLAQGLDIRDLDVYTNGVWVVIEQQQALSGFFAAPTIESGLIFSEEEAIRTMLFIRDEFCQKHDFEPNEGRASTELHADRSVTATSAAGDCVTWYVVQQEEYGEHKPTSDNT